MTLSPNPHPSTIHSSTSLNEWTTGELKYFRIRQKKASYVEFFGKAEAELREPQFFDPGFEVFLHDDVLQKFNPSNAAELIVKNTIDALRNLHLNDFTASMLRNGEPNTEMLAQGLFSMLGFISDATFRTGLPTTLNLCGEQRNVKIDIAIFDQLYTSCSMLCAEYKHGSEHCNTFARLMAYAIAVFQQINRTRSLRNFPRLKVMIIPGLIFNGGLLDFYRITVTEELANAVQGGRIPDTPTQVPWLSVSYNDPKERAFGIFLPSARKPALKILENMRDFMMTDTYEAPEAWNRFLNPNDASNTERTHEV